MVMVFAPVSSARGCAWCGGVVMQWLHGHFAFRVCFQDVPMGKKLLEGLPVGWIGWIGRGDGRWASTPGARAGQRDDGNDDAAGQQHAQARPGADGVEQ